MEPRWRLPRPAAALAGFRVLGLTRFPAGPYAAMVLAGLGADAAGIVYKHPEAAQ